MQTYTDFLKEQFIKTGECIKDNFEELYPQWRNELEDSELDEFAYQWFLVRFDIHLKANKK